MLIFLKELYTIFSACNKYAYVHNKLFATIHFSYMSCIHCL